MLNVNDNILLFKEYFNLNIKLNSLLIILQDENQMPYRGLNNVKFDSKNVYGLQYYSC